jgi:hypothetical protein
VMSYLERTRTPEATCHQRRPAFNSLLEFLR